MSSRGDPCFDPTTAPSVDVYSRRSFWILAALELFQRQSQFETLGLFLWDWRCVRVSTHLMSREDHGSHRSHLELASYANISPGSIARPEIIHRRTLIVSIVIPSDLARISTPICLGSVSSISQSSTQSVRQPNLQTHMLPPPISNVLIPLNPERRTLRLQRDRQPTTLLRRIDLPRRLRQ